MSLLETTAVVFGFLCVWLTIRQSIWCWPTGLIQVSLFIVIFWQVRLYSDMLLHAVYVVMQLYGWYWWLHGGRDGGALGVSRLGRAERLGWPLLVLTASLAWGWLMAHYTNAALPYADAFTTMASLAAQWLMARKKLASWLFWISVDVAAIAIYWHKDLRLTAALYAAFLIMASLGLMAWRKSLSLENHRANQQLARPACHKAPQPR